MLHDIFQHVPKLRLRSRNLSLSGNHQVSLKIKTRRRTWAFVLIGATCLGMMPAVTPAMAATGITAPSWRILTLLYNNVDFSYVDSSGSAHHYVGSLTADNQATATTAANTFATTDVPTMSSGYEHPQMTVRPVDVALTQLDSVCNGYWPGPDVTTLQQDPQYDSVVVIWPAYGRDLVTNTASYIGGDCGGLTWPGGTGRGYSAFYPETFSTTQRNVFKHEWGHQILYYYDAAGTAPKPAVDNHKPDSSVDCVTGKPYLLVDDSDTNPVPNSIFNDSSGFSHDYYSGLTASSDNPTQCLGINPAAWGSGGPVSKPPANLLVNGSFEQDANGDGRPDAWTSNAAFTRTAAATYGGSYAGRHQATNNSGQVISQIVMGLTGGAKYSFSGGVEIPSTGDTFSYRIQISWRNAKNVVLRTDTIASFSAPTQRWKFINVDKVAPAGTSRAAVRLVTSGLNGTIYVDNLAFRHR